MSSDESGQPLVEGREGSGETVAEKSPFGGEWDRRTLFKGAALGTAAAAMYTGGRMAFSPLAAYADNLSGLNCTANDVRIVGPGIILNEPCICSGFFTAQVQFHIINNTGTSRYCVTTHLCPGKDASGNVVVLAQDIVFGNIPANFDGNVTVTIPNYPCGSGLVCFGTAGTGVDGGFAKGEDCPAGQCCSTITWNVKASDPCPDTTRQISSKCRHQQICIQGRGITTVDCDTSTAGNQNDCTVPCGGTASVRVCTTNASNLGPFTFELGNQSFGPTADTCHVFSVGPITADTTLTATVTDSTGCARTASVTLRTSVLSPVISVAGDESCGGVLTFSTDPGAGFSGCTFAYKIDGVAAADTNTLVKYVKVNSDGTLDFRWLDGNCHTISVLASCGSCTGPAEINVKQCVTTNKGCAITP